MHAASINQHSHFVFAKWFVCDSTCSSAVSGGRASSQGAARGWWTTAVTHTLYLHSQRPTRCFTPQLFKGVCAGSPIRGRRACRGYFSVVRQDPERNGVRVIHACVDAWSDLLDILTDHVGVFTAHREPDPCHVHVRQGAADDQQHRPHPSRGWPTSRVTIEAHLYFICFCGDEPIRSWRRSRQSHVSWVLRCRCSRPRV